MYRPGWVGQVAARQRGSHFPIQSFAVGMYLLAPGLEEAAVLFWHNPIPQLPGPGKQQVSCILDVMNAVGGVLG